ncbi:MAG: hypothetical protein M1833_002328 [Piccolia ochrophora]|nr:MAG: hypothetical protein M1833_002328 [Piccolia ochrophora]
MEEEERPRKLQKTGHSSLGEVTVDDPDLTGETSSPKSQVLGSNPDGNQSTNEPPSTAVEHHKEKDEDAQTPNGTTSADAPISKNQLKKQRRKERWEQGRDYRKARRKEKLAEKKAQKKDDYADSIANSVQSNGKPHEDIRPDSGPPSVAPAKSRHARSVLAPITFILDCSFDDLMMEKERISLGSQVTRCYAENTKAPIRGHLYITSFNGLLKERFETVLADQHHGWKSVTFTEDDYVKASETAKALMNSPGGGKAVGPMLLHPTPPIPSDAVPTNTGELIYLTSDSPDTLTRLLPNCTYVIGGLVDRNRHKGICYQRATECGVKTAKLPIGEYLKMSSRFVLTTNQVLEIMLRWLELGDWGEAFLCVVPKRKGGVLKEKVEEGGGVVEKGEGEQKSDAEVEHVEHVSDDEDQTKPVQ